MSVPVEGVTIGATERGEVRAALVKYALGAFNLGVSVIALPFRLAAMVPGVVADVPAPFEFDFIPSPSNTGNLAVTGLQIATLSSTTIYVNGSLS